MSVGLPELLVVLVVLLVVLGPRRIAGAGRGLGSGLRGFKESITGGDDHADVVEQEGRETADPGASRSRADPAATDHPGGEETVTGEPVDEPRRDPRS